MKRFYDSLSAADRRRYAGIEALRYGPGGRRYMTKVLGRSRRTVSKGAQGVGQLSKAEVDRRMRRPGAGQKPYQAMWPDIDDQCWRKAGNGQCCFEVVQQQEDAAGKRD